MTGYEVIDNYITLVRSGSYPVCREQLALCDFVEHVFKTEDIRIDTEQLAKYFNFQRFFPFNLLPWEKFVFALHNCTYKADGQLRFPVLFCLLGRGAGKNGYLSFETFCMLPPINGIKHYDVDIFAMSEDQAKTSFTDVYDVLEDNKATLEKYFKWNLEVITNRATKSSLRFRTSGVKTKDGGRPG